MYRFNLFYGFQFEYKSVINQDVYAEVIIKTLSLVF